MIRGESVVGSSEEVPVAIPQRERVVVRRRRAHSRHRTGAGRWTARKSRRRIIRAAIVCTGVLLLMAAGLYFGLQRQEVSPAESQLHGRMVALSRASG